MIVSIKQILPPGETADVRATLEEIAFVDGRATAGWSAKLVKSNRQAAPGHVLDALRSRVAERILSNPLFALAVRPKALTLLTFARYHPGDAYGAHVDDALMGGLRTDVAFTLFLSDANSCDGGELVIESPAGEDTIKLDAGSLVAYPATTLHRVQPVTRGERLVAVGWARSLIRSAEQRELLFDLDTARRALFQREGKTRDGDLLAKCAANLMRMWAED
ncbi:MAG: Fe2+-dependent dioxygenase [Hyphomicrobium sp.]|nr:Fe2+-dependent dioxygenase [Hyphomicrobium sp.]